MQSKSARIRALEYKYRFDGGMEGRYKALYKKGKSLNEIAEEFGILPNTLRNYWLRKWKHASDGKEPGK